MFIYFKFYQVINFLLCFLEMGRWKVKFSALPCENLPVKSHERKLKPKRHIDIVKNVATTSEPKETYKSYDHFEESLFQLRFKG